MEIDSITNVLKPCSCESCKASKMQKGKENTKEGGFLDGLFGSGIPVDTSVSIDVPASTLVKIGISIILIFLIVVLVKKNLK